MLLALLLLGSLIQAAPAARAVLVCEEPPEFLVCAYAGRSEGSCASYYQEGVALLVYGPVVVYVTSWNTCGNGNDPSHHWITTSTGGVVLTPAGGAGAYWEETTNRRGDFCTVRVLTSFASIPIDCTQLHRSVPGFHLGSPPQVAILGGLVGEEIDALLAKLAVPLPRIFPGGTAAAAWTNNLP